MSIERDEFDSLIEEREEEILRFAAKFQSKLPTDQIIARAIGTAWAKRKEFDEELSASEEREVKILSWIKGIIKRIAKERVANAYHFPGGVLQADSREEVGPEIDAECSELMKEALSILKKDERKALELFADGYDGKEAAKRMNKKHGAYRQTLKVARKKIENSRQGIALKQTLRNQERQVGDNE